MPQRKVIEVMLQNGGVQKAFDRLAREELRSEVKAPVGESQSVEDEGHYSTTWAYDTRIVYREKAVDAIGDLEVLANNGYESVMVEGIWRNRSRDYGSDLQAQTLTTGLRAPKRKLGFTAGGPRES